MTGTLDQALGVDWEITVDKDIDRVIGMTI